MASVRQCVWKGDEQLGSVSVVSVLLRVQWVRGHVGDGDLQHHQPLAGEGEHLHVVLISAEAKKMEMETDLHSCQEVNYHHQLMVLEMSEKY